MPRTRRRGGDALFGSAGWLFADLMLAVVVMVALAVAITAPKPAPPKPHPKPPVTTTTTPTPTTPALPPGLAPAPIKLDVEVDANGLLNNDPNAINGMRQSVAQQVSGPLGGRRVGVVLTFGTSSSGAIQRGITVANTFNTQVLQALGGQFTGAAYEGYFQGGGDLNKITLQMFVFNN
jgi:hypothetical protein